MFAVSHLIGFGAGASDAFSPSNISGLQFWVRSDLGITKDGSDFVSSWADQSGNGRDLTEATNKPLWVNSLINGYPAIRFDGTNDMLNTAAFAVSQPMTFFLVMKQVSSTDGDRIFDTHASASNTPQMLQRSGITLQSNGFDGSNVASDTTSFHYYKAVFNGVSSLLSIDGGADDTDADDLSGSLSILTLGRSNFGGGLSYANFEVAEVLIYNSAISGSNLTNMNAYFAARYGL